MLPGAKPDRVGRRILDSNAPETLNHEHLNRLPARISLRTSWFIPAQWLAYTLPKGINSLSSRMAGWGARLIEQANVVSWVPIRKWKSGRESTVHS